MARLPQPGGDTGTWGDILNDFLSVAHNTDGTLKTGSGGAAGDVNGPSSSTDNAIARYDGTTGKVVQASNAAIDDSGQLLLPATGSTGGVVIGGDANLYRLQANIIATDSHLASYGTVYITRPAGTSVALESYVSPEGNARYSVRSDGQITWGSGAGARDTNLYRSAADTLKTDDTFQAAGGISATRITKRIATLTDGATVTPDVDAYDGGKLLTLSQDSTIANPTGTPTNFQQYTLKIKSSAARNLTFGSQYRGGNDIALPTTTTGASKTDYYGFQWNADDSKWDLIAIARGY